MTDEVVVVVHEAGTSDSRGVPGVLTNTYGVVVPAPPARLLDRGAELEVLLVPLPLPDQSEMFPRRIERIRVDTVTDFVADDGTSSALLLQLVTGSSHVAADLGPESAEIKVEGPPLHEHGGDLWSAMVDADPSVEDRLRGIDDDLLARLPAVERAQRLPRWSTVPAAPQVLGEPDDDKIRRGWWCYIWSCG